MIVTSVIQDKAKFLINYLVGSTVKGPRVLDRLRYIQLSHEMTAIFVFDTDDSDIWMDCT